MFNLIPSWFSFNRRRNLSKHQVRSTPYGGFRTLRHEQLEDRRMLATLTVSTNTDSSVLPVNDGILELREAITYVNGAIPGADDRTAWIDESVDPLGTNDTILFDSSLAGGTILLTEGDLDITEAVTIDASTLSGSLTVDASGNDPTPTVDNGDGTSVFDIYLTPISNEIQDVTLAGLTITGGDHPLIPNVTSSGGGVDFGVYSSYGTGEASLTIRDTVITGNHTESNGGGLYAYTTGFEGVVLENTHVNIVRSSVENNTAAVSGGGVFADLNGNNIDTEGTALNLVDSTITGNEATNNEGGGIWVCTKYGGRFNATNSTISGNSATGANGQGGGLWISRYHRDSDPYIIAKLDHVTITGNSSPDGGGMFSDDTDPKVITTLKNTIVSGNDDGAGLANNIAGAIEAISSYNLIGPGTAANPTGAGNIVDPTNNPQLSGLANNGGPTQTHAPLSGSLAIDAGDPAAVAGVGGVPQFDQRGTGFGRVVNGRIDIGAYEVGSLKVLNVIVSNASSTHAPFSFDTVDGFGTQLKTVPVGFADASSVLAISVVFSEDVDQSTITENSLGVLGLRSASLPDVVSGTFGYDAATRTATWEFDGWRLAGDNYLIHLDDSVRDVHGSTNYLDGEWTNPLSVSTTNSLVSEFPSGDGTPGGDFNFVITILPGDAELDGDVDSNDLGILVNFFGQGSLFFEQGDFDGDGTVTSADLGILLNNFGLEMDTLFVLADLDGDLDVDDDDILILLSNLPTASGATYAQGDLNGDGAIDQADVDLAFDQYNFGVDFDWVA